MFYVIEPVIYECNSSAHHTHQKSARSSLYVRASSFQSYVPVSNNKAMWLIKMRSSRDNYWLMPKEIFSETKINRSRTSFYSLWNIMVFGTAIVYIWKDYKSIIKTRIRLLKKYMYLYIICVCFCKRRFIKGTAFLFQSIFVLITHKNYNIVSSNR